MGLEYDTEENVRKKRREYRRRIDKGVNPRNESVGGQRQEAVIVPSSLKETKLMIVGIHRDRESRVEKS